MNRNNQGGMDDDLMNGTDEIANLFVNSHLPSDMTEPDSELEAPVFTVDLDEIDGEAKERAKIITEKLAGYFFNPIYLESHPYIPQRVANEMENIRRLLKMLTINEHAQDTLIRSIAYNPGKGAIYSSLTSLQSTMLSIQSQLDDKTTKLENIFKEMQDNTALTFADKEKEKLDDGSLVAKGARDFIKQIEERMLLNKKKKEDNVEQNVEL